MVQSLYHLSDEQLRRLTIKEFYIKQKNVYEVAKLYNSALLEAEAQANNRKQETANTLRNLIHSHKRK